MEELAGRVRVGPVRAGAPSSLGGLRLYAPIGRAQGAKAISLRVYELAAGLSPGLCNGPADEVLFVRSGEGTIFLDGRAFAVGPDMGIFVPAGSLWTARALRGPLVLFGARCPEPERELPPEPARTEPLVDRAAPERPPVVRLRDRASRPTGDRSYQVLVDESTGSLAVTQFVGVIPPGRAPDHYHLYEEVLVVLGGRGRLWAGATSAPIEEGSCIYLPPRQMHCLENGGPGPLTLLGVFYPAGSPAVRYGERGGS